jgi:hypothetical protein
MEHNITRIINNQGCKGMGKRAKKNGIRSMVIAKKIPITTKVHAKQSYWDLIIEEQDMLHLSRQFHEDYYNAIEAFQGEKKINVHIHVRDLQEQNGVYVQPRKEL